MATVPGQSYRSTFLHNRSDFFTIEAIENHRGLNRKALFEAGIKILTRDRYTTKKDKNNNEIYEGNIVSDCYKNPDKEIDWHYLGPSKKGIVVWYDSHAGFYIETNRWKNDMYIAKIVGPITSHKIISEWVEIIGNIVESPEQAEQIR